MQRVGEGAEIEGVELDRAAWNLPRPLPDELRLPPADNWPPWPFDAAEEQGTAEAEGQAPQDERPR